MREKKICPLCHSNDLEPLRLRGVNKGLLSDSRIVDAKGFLKYYCRKCALGFRLADKTQVDDYYEQNYTLNTSAGEEHYFFLKDRWVKRSQAIFDLFYRDELSKASPDFSLLEIGCGKGSLLRVFQDNFPHASLTGIEPSRKAAALGRRRGLNVINSDLQEYADSHEEKFDYVISFGVLEHVLHPVEHVGLVKAMLRSNGKLMMGMPNADILSYDVFFDDHLSHFSLRSLSRLLDMNGLLVDRWIRPQLILENFLCVVAKNGHKAGVHPRLPRDKVRESFRFFKSVFKDVNRNIGKAGMLAVYGGSEVLSLLYAYTELNKPGRIALIIDDRPKTKYFHNIPIVQSRSLSRKRLEGIDLIVVATNKIYYQKITNRLGAQGYQGAILLPFRLRYRAGADRKDFFPKKGGPTKGGPTLT
jgi:2-polyprenyl-3-methyl-5-hydroxy-6-metoxy-1,4-benzoquinol methylase